MKKLYLIGGTMGAGKTTVSQQLKQILPNCAFLDGDWCWDMAPFVVNEETKAMVMDNICHTLNGFLHCSVFENAVFCWVMHEQYIIDEIIFRVRTKGWEIIPISLIISEAALCDRLSRDIEAGVREADIIERSSARLPLYEKLNTIKLDVSALSPLDAAKRIAELK